MTTAETDRLRSGLYVGTVRHRRTAPRKNAFRYGVFQLLLDLDELPAIDAAIPFFGYNRAGPVSFHDRDHMGGTAEPVRDKLARWLDGRGRELGDSRVMMLTNPRVLGYGFNPVSHFFCMDAADELRFTVAEVFNTFGEVYCYLLDGAETVGGTAVRSRVDKRFHVSPFMPIDGVRYEWIVTPPGERMTLHIDEFEADRKYFDATLKLARRPLTAASLARALVRYPHMTARTIMMIHWQAAKLWAKRAPFFRKPEPPDNGLDGWQPGKGKGRSRAR